ncbi:hypothetical protein ACE193_22780 [Bernardetia sp. OM2101]|uniref:hypothetical protein n=1 Tax=Bernardetia sp. OM2101 TaxID=3344876 RepID=UPI0035CFB7BA
MSLQKNKISFTDNKHIIKFKLSNYHFDYQSLYFINLRKMIGVSVLLFLGIIAVHYFFNATKTLAKVYFPALFFKFFCGTLLYQLHLSFMILPDLIFYKQDIIRLSDYFWSDTYGYLTFLLTGKLNSSWNYIFATEGERAFFFVRYLSLMNVLAAKNMYLTSLYSSLMAFFGLWVCANRLAEWFIKPNDSDKKIRKIKLALSVGFFFTPSVAFWASSMMKESFLWLIMGLVIALFLDILRFNYSKIFVKENKLKFIGIVIKLILFSLLCLCLFLLKYYYFALLIPLLLAFGISFFAHTYFAKFYNPSFRFQLAVFLGSFVFIVGLASNLHPNLWFSRLSEAIFINQQNILATSNFDSQINFTYSYDFEPIYHNYKNGEYQTYPSYFQLIEQSPKALLAGLFFPLEIDFSSLGSSAFNYYRLASVIENWIILFLFVHTISIKKLFYKVRSLFSSQKSNSKSNSTKNDSLAILWLVGIIFCVGMATLLALSAPNLGTLVRYKIGFLPFFIFGIFMCLD